MSTTTGMTVTELREHYEALKARSSSMRTKANETAKKIQNTAVRTGGAWLATRYVKNTRTQGGTPFSLFGLTPLQTIAVLGLVGGELLDGEAGEVVGALGEGCLCAAASEMANNG